MLFQTCIVTGPNPLSHSAAHWSPAVDAKRLAHPKPIQLERESSAHDGKLSNMSNIEDEQIQPVVIPYALLQRPDDTLPSLLQRAFSSSPTSLGLVLVSDLPPSFPTLRRRLLLMSNEFASLPAATRERYTDPASSYLYGWSHGKERMNGQLDVAKGSFYANPQWDETPPTVEGGLPGKNVWPAEVEGYEETFKALCALMINVGGLVAQACEAVVRNVAGREGLANRKTVEELILTSKANKARLLHYVSLNMCRGSQPLTRRHHQYPREGSSFVLPSLGADCQAEPPTTTRIDDSWCSEHIDHSILTVLCPAMYLFHPTAATAALDPLIIPSPSASTGLYIKTRAGKTIKATIPCVRAEIDLSDKWLTCHLRTGKIASRYRQARRSSCCLRAAWQRHLISSILPRPRWDKLRSRPSSGRRLRTSDGGMFSQGLSVAKRSLCSCR